MGWLNIAGQMSILLAASVSLATWEPSSAACSVLHHAILLPAHHSVVVEQYIAARKNVRLCIVNKSLDAERGRHRLSVKRCLATPTRRSRPHTMSTDKWFVRRVSLRDTFSHFGTLITNRHRAANNAKVTIRNDPEFTMGPFNATRPIRVPYVDHSEDTIDESYGTVSIGIIWKLNATVVWQMVQERVFDCYTSVAIFVVIFANIYEYLNKLHIEFWNHRRVTDSVDQNILVQPEKMT